MLIIITGLPCTGKTMLGRKLAAELGLPFVHKDGIKEILFENLGWKDREWSKKLGWASIDLLYYFIGVQLAAGRSCIVESNFKAEFANLEFLALQQKYDFDPFQVVCKTEGKILYRRFKERSESGERHPGHVDYLNYDEFKSTLLEGGWEPLDIGGKVLEVDTTDFQAIDYKSLLRAIGVPIKAG
ncbi:MAG: AAA family ATPase [Anaerolineae bacterium]|nr:AAA family ATPase [Anaerolineae bacterium]